MSVPCLLQVTLPPTTMVLCHNLSQFPIPSSHIRLIIYSAYASRLLTGLSLASSPLRSGLSLATYTCVPLPPSSISWYQSKDGDALRMGRWPSTVHVSQCSTIFRLKCQ